MKRIVNKTTNIDLTTPAKDLNNLLVSPIKDVTMHGSLNLNA